MRVVVAILLILHGLAHAGAGMWSSGPIWLVTLSWCVATVAFMAAGFALLRVAAFRDTVSIATVTGAIASLVLLAYLPHPLIIPGALLDVALATMVLQMADEPLDQAAPSSTRTARLASALAVLVVAYAGAVILLRPSLMRLGTTSADRRAALFGDSLYPNARYIVNNAITIRAPADSVWPWLAQIGQDRAGFYSHSVLENLFGAEIKNSDTLVAAWQGRRVGELVRAVPPDYLGGRLGPDVGWHIVAMDSGRALVLENWGAFVVRPVDANTSKLHIRQHNPGTPSVLGTMLSPAGLLLFEPAHFFMQRGMLRGIKERAERRS